MHPDTKKEVKKSLGRFGPYIVHDGEFRSVPKDMFFDMDLPKAIQRLREPKGRSSNMLKELGTHPKNQKPIQLMKGKFGPYLKNNNKNYSLPKDLSLETVNLSLALKLITEGQKKPSGKIAHYKSSKNKVDKTPLAN